MNTSKDEFEMHAAEEEEELDDEPSRGNDSKFFAERSEAGMIANEKLMPAGGSAGTEVNSFSSSNIDSKKNSGDRANERASKKDSSRGRGARGRNKLPDEFCRDYLFYTCARKDCKYKHPSKNSQEYKDAKATRPGWPIKDRSRSPRLSRNEQSHESHDHRDPEREDVRDGNPQICRDFLRNNCYRGKDCRFNHPPDGDHDELPWPQLCLDYRSGNCKRSDCRFLHYCGDDEDYYMRTGSVRKQLWQHFADIALKDENLLKGRPVCRNFVRYQECSLSVCRLRHISQDEYDDEIYHLMNQMVYERCRRFHRDVPPPPSPREGRAREDDYSSESMMPPPAPLINHESQPPFRPEYDDMDVGGPSRGSYDSFSSNPYSHSAGGPGIEIEHLNRENIDLRRMMSEDTARFKSDAERLQIDNIRLQDDLNFLKNTPDLQQISGVRQENAEMAKKLASANEWLGELQSKMVGARRECDDLKENVKVLNMELATVKDEKLKLTRKNDELEAKLQIADLAKVEANLAIEKKTYLENRIQQYMDSMKRCEAEIIHTLENTFNINTPQVMSYFPTWGYFKNSLNEVVNQITSNSNKTAPASQPQGNILGGFNNQPPSYGSNGPTPAATTSGFNSYNNQSNSGYYNKNDSTGGGYGNIGGNGAYFGANDSYANSGSNNGVRGEGNNNQWKNRI